MGSPCVRAAGALFASPESFSQEKPRGLLQPCEEGEGEEEGEQHYQQQHYPQLFCFQQQGQKQLQQQQQPDEHGANEEEDGENVDQDGVSFFDDLRWECATDDLMSDDEDKDEPTHTINASINTTSVNSSRIKTSATASSEAASSSSSPCADATSEASTETRASPSRSHYARGAAAVSALTLLLCYLRATTTIITDNNNITITITNNAIPTKTIPILLPTTTNGLEKLAELTDSSFPSLPSGDTITTAETTATADITSATAADITSAASHILPKEHYQPTVLSPEIAVIEAVTTQPEPEIATAKQTTFAGTIRDKQPQQQLQQQQPKSLPSSSREKIHGFTSRSIPPAVVIAPHLRNTGSGSIINSLIGSGSGSVTIANAMTGAVRMPLLPEHSQKSSGTVENVRVKISSATTTTAKETQATIMTPAASTINSQNAVDQFDFVNNTTTTTTTTSSSSSSAASTSSSASSSPSLSLPSSSSSLWRALSIHPYCDVFAWSLSWLFPDDDACVPLTLITGLTPEGGSDIPSYCPLLPFLI